MPTPKFRNRPVPPNAARRAEPAGVPAARSRHEARFAIAIMAAGKGTRLKSRHPKVLHRIAGKALLDHVIRAARSIVPAGDIFVISGHEAERVEDAVRDTGVRFVRQTEQLGTGDAIKRTRDAVAGYDHLIVLSGDVPLLRPATIERLRDFHLDRNSDMTVLTATLDDPANYGRVVRRKRNGKAGDEIEAIVEKKDLKPQHATVREINSGIYCFRTASLFGHIDEITNQNNAREYYLTDMAAILAGARGKVLALGGAQEHEVLGVNDRTELAALDAELRAAKCRELMLAGVTIYRPETCVIDAEVTVGPDTVIEPFVQLLGNTKIGSDTIIRSHSMVFDCEVGDEVELLPYTHIRESSVGRGARLGPFTNLRPGCVVGEQAHVGNFVEMKKTKLGRGSKANHLSYIGDAVVGERSNIGAGTITCNYDGVHKHQTTIGNGAFIGSDTTLVAPITIGDGAYVGAASCVTEDVPADALALARARQIVKPGWAAEKRAAQKAKA